jgi:protein-disulfide isomerase
VTLASLASALFAAAAAAAPAPAPAPGAEDLSLGSPQAPVTVIEYTSPTCPECARFHAEAFARFRARWVDTGKVRYVLREAPVHPNLDWITFQLARCAGGKGYLKVIEDVMRAQPEYLGDADLPEILRKFDVVLLREMQAAGMSQAEAMSCIGDAKAAQALRARVQHETKQYAIDKVPAFIVGGVKLQAQAGKPVDLSQLDAAIQAALARANSPKLRR